MPYQRIPLVQCPHRDDLRIRKTATLKCARCEVTTHLRLCTACGDVYCCESSNAHNVEHFQKTGHAIISSVPPESPNYFLWCWKCNAYLAETGGTA
jgi:uncharacterized UBP type Zn finger protein